MSNIRIKKRRIVPIYDAVVWLVVADDLHRERVKMNHIFGEFDYAEFSYSALMSYDEAGTFGLFFETKSLDHNRIGHEVFHLTHRILDWVGTNFDSKHHEHAAVLHGFLLSWVMNETKKYRKVK